MTRTLTIDLGSRSYPIHIGHGLLGARASYATFEGRECRLLTDENVARAHLEAATAALGLGPSHCRIVPPGEPTKTWAAAGELLDWMLRTRLPRDGMLVALGGGVIGDLGGFAAAVYQRGIDFIQVPTTLLAQVDSSVGGKTGVNHSTGKNMVGAFHQPLAVIADLDTLRTLPPRELRAGVAEVIKYGLLGDPAFVGWLEQEMENLLALQPEVLARAVHRCCEMKAEIVAADEREAGRRALLNLGHTFGHAIEAHTGYGEWLHGEAVAAGMCMAADLSARLHWITGNDAQRCVDLIARAGLPTRPPRDLEPQRFLELMGSDKKVKGGRLRLVLMKKIGSAELTADVPPDALNATLAAARIP